MNDAAPMLEKERTNYEQLKKTLEAKAESNKVKKKRFKEDNSQRIF